VLNNGQPAAPAAAAAPEVADEPASWDQLAPETAAPLGRADTDPSSRRRRPAPRRKLTEPPTVPLGRDRRFWLLVGGGTAVAAVALAFGLIALRRSGPPAPPPGPAAPRTTTVVVDPGGGEGYPTIAAALRSPRSGPLTIRVRGDLVEPDVYALNLRDVTIESESGASWTWRLPARSGPEVSLLRIAGCEGFTLRNCTLDGAGRADILVKMFSRCPGTTLENLRFTGFKQYGLHVSNCEGTADRPVTLRNLRFVTTDAKQAGLFFTAFSTNPSVKENQHIAVTDCTAEGPGKLAATSKPEHTAGVQFQPPLKPDVLP
jgi:hypothetical protein